MWTRKPGTSRSITFMRSSGFQTLAASLVLAAGLYAQESPLPTGSIRVNLPDNSPVALLAVSSDPSRATMRGAAMVLDLHMSLTLRNGGVGRIHGVTLRVVSQEVAMGGKGSVTIPSLNVAPGETFPVRIDMQLVRPTQLAAGPLVQVDLDGVLFHDLSFFGPDLLNSRRYLTACELEAQRDREHFKRVLAQEGKDGLKRQIIGSLERQRDLQPLTVKVRRVGAGVTSAGVSSSSEQMAKFAFLTIPDSPIQPVEGWAMISGNEARAPMIEVRNISSRPVKYVELGWMVSDQTGRDYSAGSLPSSNSTFYLPAGQTAKVQPDSTMNFTNSGKPVNVRKMTGFVSQVQFADGKVWVPNRQSIENPALQKVLPPSAEEQRLSDLYLRKGIDGLVEELKKY
jgi:hypothetical protein